MARHERAFAERPGSRLEPRQTRPPLFDRRHDRPSGDTEPAGAADKLVADGRSRADAVGEQRLRRDDELLDSGADLAVRAVEALAFEPRGRHELGRTALTLLLLTQAAERVADRRAEQCTGDAVDEHIALGQRFVGRDSRGGQEPTALQAHHGDRAHGPVQLGKHVLAHAHPPRGILSK